jgi:hypothetical protein
VIRFSNNELHCLARKRGIGTRPAVIGHIPTDGLERTGR